mmetsp:Transcript_1954/g.2614  ORF Transcript_1954/g.2614 Transcript_1954/m.2614 type:complete len:299 (-) Transcript_1954:276-1172(-)
MMPQPVRQIVVCAPRCVSLCALRHSEQLLLTRVAGRHFHSARKPVAAGPVPAMTSVLKDTNRVFVRSFARRSGDVENDNTKKQTEEEKKKAEEAEASKETPSSGSSGRGEAATLLGMTGFGLSMVLRNPAAARALRVAGPAGMALGVFLTVYDLGGWKLVIAVPVSILAFSCAGYFFDSKEEENIKSALVNEIRTNCVELPSDVAEALPEAQGIEYESNKWRLEKDFEGKTVRDPHWRVRAKATRGSRFSPWVLSSIEVSRGTRVEVKEGESALPPQTRNWDCTKGQLKWEVIWDTAL